MKNHEWKIHPRERHSQSFRHQDLPSAPTNPRSGFKFRRTLSLELRSVEGFIWGDRRFLPSHQQIPRPESHRSPSVRRFSLRCIPRHRGCAKLRCRSYLRERDAARGLRMQMRSRLILGSARCVASRKLDKRKTTPGHQLGHSRTRRRCTLPPAGRIPPAG